MGIVIVSTYPDKKSVEKIAKAMVSKKLAACVNYTQINSVFAWKGKMENSTEFLALFKTTPQAKNQLKKEIAKAHPYQVPEIVELKMDSVNVPYRAWLLESTTKRKPQKRDNSSKG